MRYSYIAFDVDGTLLDTERNELSTLQRLVREATGREPSWDELIPTFGMTGPDALVYLGCTPEQAAVVRPLWHDASVESVQRTPLVAGFPETLETLSRAGVRMGLVTSRGQHTVALRFPPEGEGRYFGERVCQQDTVHHKPDPEPLLECLHRAGVRPEDALYVGDSPFDMECAANAGVDGALALWGTHTPDLACTWRLAHPSDLLKICLGQAE